MLLRRMLNERAMSTTRRLRRAGLLLRPLLTTLRPPLLLVCFGRSEGLWLLRASMLLFKTPRPTQMLLCSGRGENLWLLRASMLLLL